MKKIMALTLMLAMVLTPIAHASEQYPANLFINGEQVVIPEEDGYEGVFTRDGRLWVPLRVVSEHLNYGIDYLDGLIFAMDGAGNILYMQIGQASIGSVSTDGSSSKIEMDVAPYVNDGWRTYIPISFLARAMGYDVTWDEATSTVTMVK